MTNLEAAALLPKVMWPEWAARALADIAEMLYIQVTGKNRGRANWLQGWTLLDMAEEERAIEKAAKEAQTCEAIEALFFRQKKKHMKETTP